MAANSGRSSGIPLHARCTLGRCTAPATSYLDLSGFDNGKGSMRLRRCPRHTPTAVAADQLAFNLGCTVEVQPIVALAVPASVPVPCNVPVTPTRAAASDPMAGAGRVHSRRDILTGEGLPVVAHVRNGLWKA